MADELKPVTISGELYAFLMGEGEIDGTSFGDMNAGLPGRFWWRALLRTAANDTRIEPEAADRRASEALEQKIIQHRKTMNDESNEPALRYMAAGAFEALRDFRQSLRS